MEDKARENLQAMMKFGVMLNSKMCYTDTMRKTTNPAIRFHESYTKDSDGCWVWNKYTNRGYARFNNGEKIVDAHRWYYQLENKVELKRNQHLDHLCRNRSCVNPKHLEVVNNYTNWLRGESITRKKSQQTHCIHGHELSGANLYVRNNKRRCNACHRIKAREYRKKSNG